MALLRRAERPTTRTINMALLRRAERPTTGTMNIPSYGGRKKWPNSRPSHGGRGASHHTCYKHDPPTEGERKWPNSTPRFSDVLGAFLRERTVSTVFPSGRNQTFKTVRWPSRLQGASLKWSADETGRQARKHVALLITPEREFQSQLE